MDALLRDIQPRMLAILLLSLVVLTILGSYLYIFKQPLAQLSSQQHALTIQQIVNDDGISLAEQIKLLEKDKDKLNTQVMGSGPQIPKNQMIANVIGQLDAIAASHQVQLVSVKPGSSSAIFMFEEQPFNIEVKGNYLDLYNWLKSVELQLGPMVVKQFEIVSINKDSNLRRMTLVLASYRPKDLQ